MTAYHPKIHGRGQATGGGWGEGGCLGTEARKRGYGGCEVVGEGPLGGKCRGCRVQQGQVVSKRRVDQWEK